MTTTIKIKSTTTAGKIPTTSDLEIAELGLNLADEKLYSRNSSGIFEIGKPGEVPSGGTPDRPTSPELGDLFYDITIDSLLYWNGSEWVPVGNEAIALNDLSDVDTAGVTNGMVLPTTKRLANGNQLAQHRCLLMSTSVIPLRLLTARLLTPLAITPQSLERLRLTRVC